VTSGRPGPQDRSAPKSAVWCARWITTCSASQRYVGRKPAIRRATYRRGRRPTVMLRTKSARLGQVRYPCRHRLEGWKCPQRHSRTIGGTARNASASGGMAPPRMGTVPPVVHTTHRVAGTSTCRPILTSTCSSRQTKDARLYLDLCRPAGTWRSPFVTSLTRPRRAQPAPAAGRPRTTPRVGRRRPGARSAESRRSGRARAART
jgi:hypothetical protein